MRYLTIVLILAFAGAVLLIGCQQQNSQPTGDAAQERSVAPQELSKEEQDLEEAKRDLELALADIFAEQPAWKAELEGRKNAFDLLVLRDSFQRIDHFLSRWGSGRVDLTKLGKNSTELEGIRRERAKAYATAVVVSIKEDARGVYEPDAVEELRSIVRALESSGLTPQDAGTNAGELRQLLLREEMNAIGGQELFMPADRVHLFP